jgi:hypothetical protein
MAIDRFHASTRSGVSRRCGVPRELPLSFRRPVGSGRHDTSRQAIGNTGFTAPSSDVVVFSPFARMMLHRRARAFWADRIRIVVPDRGWLVWRRR